MRAYKSTRGSRLRALCAYCRLPTVNCGLSTADSPVIDRRYRINPGDPG